MKKFLSLFLALALALTFAVPALAVDTESPDYQAGYTAGRADGYDEGYSDGYYDGYNDATGYEPTEYEKGYDAGWEDGYCRGLEDGTDAAAQNTYEEPPCAELRDDYDLCTYEDGLEDGTADGYASGYDDGFYNACGLWGWQAQELMDKGGTLGQINVLFNGSCIQFPDTFPKLVHSRTMIPIRAVSEGMDKLVDWDQDTQTVTISEKDADASVVLTIGSETAAVCRDGESSEITMDCAPYLDGDRTMVPVRFVSEALGYTVLWDQDFETVVIVDAAALADEIDQNFTKFNEMSARQNAEMQLGDQYKVDCDLNGSLTLFDETGKGTDYAFGMVYSVATDSSSFRVDMTLDLQSLCALLMEDPELTEDDAISLSDWNAVDWSHVTATVLMDKTGHVWMKIPILNTLALDVDEDAWLDAASLNELTAQSDGSATITLLPTLNLDALMNLPEDATVGQIIVTMASVDENSFYFDDSVSLLVGLFEALYGDSSAKSSGSTCTWTLDADKLLECIGLTRADLADLGWALNLKGKTIMNTNGRSSITGSLTASSDLYSTVTGKLDVKGDPSSADMTLKAAMDDLFDLFLSVKCSVEKLDTLPDFAPPAGAEILNLADLLVEIEEIEE